MRHLHTTAVYVLVDAMKRANSTDPTKVLVVINLYIRIKTLFVMLLKFGPLSHP